MPAPTTLLPAATSNDVNHATWAAAAYLARRAPAREAEAFWTRVWSGSDGLVGGCSCQFPESPALDVPQGGSGLSDASGMPVAAVCIYHLTVSRRRGHDETSEVLMRLFSSKKASTSAGGGGGRQIPLVAPDYYGAVYEAGLAWGSQDSLSDVVAYVDNAIFNVGSQILSDPYDRRKLAAFQAKYERRPKGGPGHADAMIDTLTEIDTGINETLSTLLSRILDVNSRPPT